MSSEKNHYSIGYVDKNSLVHVFPILSFRSFSDAQLMLTAFSKSIMCVDGSFSLCIVSVDFDLQKIL